MQLLLRAQHLSDGRVDVTVEKIQLETGKAGGQVGVRTLLIDHKADRNIGHNQTGIDESPKNNIESRKRNLKFLSRISRAEREI